MDYLNILVERQTSNRSRAARLATGAIVGIAIGCFIFVVLALLCCYCCCFRRRRAKQPTAGTYGNPGGGMMGRLRGMRGGGPSAKSQQGGGMAEAGYGDGYPQQPAPVYR